MEEKKFLPIGTVVLLKNGKKELMITGYCIEAKGDVYDKNGKVENGNKKTFDYGACLYPEGVMSSDQSFAFNHENIEKICFKGYVTESQQRLSDALHEALKEEGQE